MSRAAPMAKRSRRCSIPLPNPPPLAGEGRVGAHAAENQSQLAAEEANDELRTQSPDHPGQGQIELITQPYGAVHERWIEAAATQPG
jgi:hypothetical protein